MGNVILNHQQIEHKVNRIAYQIFEANVKEKEIYLAGIQGGGSLLAKKIADVLTSITDAKIQLCDLSMDKKNPVNGDIKTSIPLETFKNKSVVLVDDVLSTGKTLIYGVHYFLQVPLKQLKTVVLVNRNFKKFPVKADFKGISLSTSMKEHIEVVLDNKNNSVLLLDK
jgi:pyrimidine operon attenuation protein/uracil phosphoribosyltransferase